MKLIALLLRTMALTVASLLWHGCDQRELCYDHSHGVPVEVTFDWSAAPDAAPSTMVVWAFPADGTDGQRFELPVARRSASSHIRLTPGSYTLLCYNGSTDLNREGGMCFDDLYITTAGYSLLGPLNRSDKAPRPSDTEDEPVRTQADHLYCHTLQQPLTIKPTDGASGVSHRVQFTPRRVTAVWNIRIEDIVNLTPALEASAIVTGVAERWHFASSAPTGAEVTVPFPLTVCSEGCLKASVVLFGDAAPHDVSHRLRVYTGSKYYYDYDITAQVHSASGNAANIDIVVKGMTLPSTGSEMAPGMSDWEDGDEVEIDM